MINYISPGYYPFVKGGSENQAKLVIDKLIENKIDFKLLTLNFGNKKDYSIKEIHRLKLLGFFSNKLLIITAILQYIFFKKNKSDIFIFQQLTIVTFILILLTRSENIFLRLSNSGDLFDFYKIIGKRRAGFIAKVLKVKIKKFISINPQISEQLTSYNCDNFVEINNAVLSNKFILNNKFKLVLISRFKKHKNIQFVKKLFKSNYDIDIFGEEGDYYDHIKKICQKHPLIKINKPYKNKSVPFDYSKPVLIHPSFQEGTSNVVLEALSMGVPVICNNIKANSIFGTKGENGVFSIDVNHPNKWIECIDKLKNDALFYKKVSFNGSSFIEKNHSDKIIFSKFLDTVYG
mgnify:CR=1 FL=1|tara:strand:+ start:2178 stop:3221 length:1044 start_codon:yes stop_codon:yes gene_type:complete